MTHSIRSHTESIRNVAMLGHAGAGKTTLIEALLAKAGEIRAAGRV
jgi:elongation factor G